jgi:ATP-dependent DNA helicase RecG
LFQQSVVFSCLAPTVLGAFLIEQWGSGIQRMTLACTEQGLDAPKFEEIGTHFRVMLSTERRHAPAKDSRDETILTLLNRHAESGLSTAQIAKEVGVSPRSARTRLASLVDRGLVAEIGSGPQDPHRRYFAVIQEKRTNPDPQRHR